VVVVVVVVLISGEMASFITEPRREKERLRVRARASS